MDMNAIITGLRDGIAVDETIKSWCLAAYSKVHTVWVGIDARDLPPAEAFPIISIYPLARKSGNGQETIIHHVGISVGVFDETKAVGPYVPPGGADPDDETAPATITEYAGIQNVESLRKLAADAVVAVLEETLHLSVSGLEVTCESIDTFPYFLADMAISADQYLSQGDDFFQ